MILHSRFRKRLCGFGDRGRFNYETLALFRDWTHRSGWPFAETCDLLEVVLHLYCNVRYGVRFGEDGVQRVALSRDSFC